MRIAQVAPLAESCPPRFYGGTERIVHFLTEELVDMGHEVTLFAAGGSITSAQLVAGCPEALRLAGCPQSMLPRHLGLVEQVRQRMHEFDIIHFHIDLVQYPAIVDWPVPTLTTLHGRLDLPGLDECYRAFPHLPLVSISDSQRRPLPPVNWAATIYHGLPPQMLPYRAQGGDYLVFLGRISPEKGPERAIELAVRSGHRLKIAAKIDPFDGAYWEERVRPLVEAHDGVEYIGEVNESQKADLLGGAAALLFPIDWPEPFGLVMIEAMSCGTPVLAFNRGSVPEVMADGVTGRVVSSMAEAHAALGEVLAMDRSRVRAHFDERFTASRMAEDYIEVYRRLAVSRGGSGEVPLADSPLLAGALDILG